MYKFINKQMPLEFDRKVTQQVQSHVTYIKLYILNTKLVVFWFFFCMTGVKYKSNATLEVYCEALFQYDVLCLPRVA